MRKALAVALMVAVLVLPTTASAYVGWQLFDAQGVAVAADPAVDPAPAGYFTQADMTAASSSFVMNETNVIQALQEVAPLIFFAFLSGWVAAFAPAHLIRFLRSLFRRQGYAG